MLLKAVFINQLGQSRYCAPIQDEAPQFRSPRKQTLFERIPAIESNAHADCIGILVLRDWRLDRSSFRHRGTLALRPVKDRRETGVDVQDMTHAPPIRLW